MSHAPCTAGYVSDPDKCEVCDPVLDALLKSDWGSAEWLVNKAVLRERVLEARKLASKKKTAVWWARPELMELIFHPACSSQAVALPAPIVQMERSPTEQPVD